MTNRSLVIRTVLLLVLISARGAVSMQGSSLSGEPHATVAASASSRPVVDVRGTWSGTFISKNADISPFTITVVIRADSVGRLIGDSSLVSECLDSHRLQVTVTGSNILLVGSDAAGDTVSFRGTIDSTGTLLTLNYIINGSPSGRCEIDNGAGTMGRR